jgi:methylated-DNA-[protein]-cysteine S-methyltransferase
MEARTIEYALFDTAIGRCGIAWHGDTIEGTQLPQQSDVEARRRLEERFEGAIEATPPSAVKGAVDLMVASLRGEADDLADVPVDLDALPPFRRKVLEVVRTIPAGETLSYGDVAAAVGAPGAARAVGQALGQNPFPIVIPCHRVLAAGGRIGGFTAQGGTTVKAKMLAVEGVTARP